MKQQKLFDQIVTHLLTQRKEAQIRCKDGELQCVYRAKTGRKCAVGGVLPDALYSPNMEGHGVAGLFKIFAGVREYFGAENMCILRDCQDLHDNRPVREWRDCLEGIAEDYDLKFNPPAGTA